MRTESMPYFDRDINDDEVFTFVVQPGDVGDRQDPERCIFARCAKRTMRTDEAWFGLCIGYARLGDEVVRFAYTKKLYDAIHAFDETGHMSPGVYKVKPPRPSETRQGKAEKNRRFARNDDGSRPQTGKRQTWHAPRGWGRGGEAQDGVAA